MVNPSEAYLLAARKAQNEPPCLCGKEINQQCKIHGSSPLMRYELRNLVDEFRVFVDAKSAQICDNLHPVTDEYRSRWKPHVDVAYKMLEQFESLLSAPEAASHIELNAVVMELEGIRTATSDDWSCGAVKRAASRVLEQLLSMATPNEPTNHGAQQAEAAPPCENCKSALALLNEHLKGRTYTDLDDALRNMLQAFISLRDNAEAASQVKAADEIVEHCAKYVESLAGDEGIIQDPDLFEIGANLRELKGTLTLAAPPAGEAWARMAQQFLDSDALPLLEGYGDKELNALTELLRSVGEGKR